MTRCWMKLRLVCSGACHTWDAWGHHLAHIQALIMALIVYVRTYVRTRVRTHTYTWLIASRCCDLFGAQALQDLRTYVRNYVQHQVLMSGACEVARPGVLSGAPGPVHLHAISQLVL